MLRHKLAVHGHYAIEDLCEATVLYDDFKLIPLAGKFGCTFRSGVDVVEIPSAVFVDRGVRMALSRIGPVV